MMTCDGVDDKRITLEGGPKDWMLPDLPLAEAQRLAAAAPPSSGEDSEDGVVITTDSEDEVDDTTGVQNDVDVPTALMTSSTLEPDAVNVMDATWWGSQQPFGRYLSKTALRWWNAIVQQNCGSVPPTGRLGDVTCVFVQAQERKLLIG